MPWNAQQQEYVSIGGANRTLEKIHLLTDSFSLIDGQVPPAMEQISINYSEMSFKILVGQPQCFFLAIMPFSAPPHCLLSLIVSSHKI